MSNSLVSVIVPTYNRAYCLPQAVESVLAQSHADLEIVLVDDGSTDATRDLVQSRWSQEPRVRYLHQPNRGVSAARNLGLRAARGEYLALLDSDDTWLPWKLEAQLACLRALPHVGMIWTDMEAIDPDGRVLQPRFLRHMYLAYRWFSPEQLFAVQQPLSGLMTEVPRTLADDAIVRSGDIFSPMLMGNLVHTSTVLLRRARYEQVGLFDESMKTGEDYDFHLRTCRAGPVALLDVAAIRYQCGRSDQLSRSELMMEIAQNFLRTVERTLETDRSRVTLPPWMLTRSLADGHLWLGETAFNAGDLARARTHLRASLNLYPWRSRAVLLYCSAMIPPRLAQPMLRFLRAVKRRLRG